MFYIMTIRHNYHTAEERLIWLRSKADILELLEALNLDSCTLRIMRGA